MELYHVVLDVKNVHIVEEFYKCILVDIMEAHSVLLKTSDEDLDDSQEVKNAEASLLLSICTLVEMGNIKHSLIRVSVAGLVNLLCVRSFIIFFFQNFFI